MKFSLSASAPADGAVLRTNLGEFEWLLELHRAREQVRGARSVRGRDGESMRGLR